jgi:hypothetical protein
MTADSLIYNIPVELIEGYRGHRMVVRVYDPAKLIDHFSGGGLEDLEYVQILTLAADGGVLANWGEGIPIDLVMYEPEAESPRLYNHAKLLDKHPVRVSMPVRRGFAHAVKVATSLQFAVRLTVGQPRSDEIHEMAETLELYLHKATVAQPIDFYHSSMQYFFRRNDNTLWAIQEEDPSKYRYVTSQGQEIISPRLLEARPYAGKRLDTFVHDFEQQLVNEHRECANCEFAEHCMGYFKWPNKDYICHGGVKELFARLKTAAGDLQNDLEAYAAMKGGVQS